MDAGQIGKTEALDAAVAVDAAIAIPCVEINPLVQKCVTECLLTCPGAEIFVMTDLPPGPVKLGAGATVVVTGPITMAAKRNQVALRSERSYIALIDSDAYPETGWLQNAIAALEADPEILIVGGPNVSPPDEPFEELCVGAAQRSFLVTGSYAFRKQKAPARFTDDLPSCNMVMRRADYVGMGGMDESYYICEDKELCARVIASGKNIYYTPDVLVYHKNRSLRLFLKQRISWGASLWPLLREQFSMSQAYLLLPTAAVCFLLTLPAAWVVPLWGYLYASVAALYIGLVGMETARHAPNLTAAPGVLAAIVIGNLGPGIGSLLGPMGLLPELKKIYRNY